MIKFNDYDGKEENRNNRVYEYRRNIFYNLLCRTVILNGEVNE